MKKTFSIGFTGKSAERFFTLLKEASVKRVIDVRLHNTSQLAGFSKREDLKFFLRELGNIEYLELPDLAPEKAMLKDYRDKKIDWPDYEKKFIDLLARRAVESRLDRDLFADGCLLCSEHEPHRCHRRIAIEYLNQAWADPLPVSHLT
jgi:uncharacterized protein (DUF488 family)